MAQNDKTRPAGCDACNSKSFQEFEESFETSNNRLLSTTLNIIVSEIFILERRTKKILEKQNMRLKRKKEG